MSDCKRVVFFSNMSSTNKSPSEISLGLGSKASNRISRLDSRGTESFLLVHLTPLRLSDLVRTVQDARDELNLEEPGVGQGEVVASDFVRLSLC